MKGPETFYWDDIHYAAIITPVNDAVVDFKVYEVVGWGADPSYRLFPIPLQESSEQTTREISEAALFYEGSIKWDGCSSVCFPEQEHCMLHFCGFSSHQRFAELNKRLYEIAAKHCGYAMEDLE